MSESEEVPWASAEEALEEWRGRTFPGPSPLPQDDDGDGDE